MSKANWRVVVLQFSSQLFHNKYSYDWIQKGLCFILQLNNYITLGGSPLTLTVFSLLTCEMG